MISFQSSPTEIMMVVYQFDIVFMHKERYINLVYGCLNIEDVLKLLTLRFLMEKEREQPKRIFVRHTISARLKCSICYDVFDKPRRLFCGHTFCKICLKGLTKPHKNPEYVPRCPLCRVAIDFKNIGYDLIAI